MKKYFVFVALSALLLIVPSLFVFTPLFSNVLTGINGGPTCRITAPDKVTANTNFILAWTTTNSPTSGSIEKGQVNITSAPTLPEGDIDTKSLYLPGTYTYTMNVTNSLGTGSCRVKVLVEPAPVLPLTNYTISAPTITTSEVFKSTGGYAHVSSVAKHKGRYYVAWNGNHYNANEGKPGQVIHMSTSSDGLTWSKPIIPFVNKYTALLDPAIYIKNKDSMLFNEDFKKLQSKAVNSKLDILLENSIKSDYIFSTNDSFGVFVPGDAAIDNEIRRSQISGKTHFIQWHPMLVEYKGRLIIFWNLARGFDESAMMMSVLRNDNSELWDSYEFRFDQKTGEAKVYKDNKDTQPSTDSHFLTVGTNLNSIFPDQVMVNGDAIETKGTDLLPTPQQATVLGSDTNPVLALSVILQQNKESAFGLDALMAPAVFTSASNLSDNPEEWTWKMSLVPLRRPLVLPLDFQKDYLYTADPKMKQRGDVGMVTAWENSIAPVGSSGNKLQMIFRILTPTNDEKDTGSSVSSGYRVAASDGTLFEDGSIGWTVPTVLDNDVSVSRGMLAQLKNSKILTMIHNYSVNGLSYSKSTDPNYKDIPQFINENTYDPYARRNLSLFFSTGGVQDLVAGPNISSSVEKVGLESVHYPYVVSENDNGVDSLLVSYSSHARPSRLGNDGKLINTKPVPDSGVDSYDTIQFAKITNLPTQNTFNLYPNTFARYALGTNQQAANIDAIVDTSLDTSVLRLPDRAGAGVEIPAGKDAGCMSFRFKLKGDLTSPKPIISFGRSIGRTNGNGLRVARTNDGKGYNLLLNNIVIESIQKDVWKPVYICFNLTADAKSLCAMNSTTGAIKVLTAKDMEKYNFNKQVYLGDNTLAKYSQTLPDIEFDISSGNTGIGFAEYNNNCSVSSI